MTQRVACDVLVIGGGLAGCEAALAAQEHGAIVTLVHKDQLGVSGNSSVASGGLAVSDLVGGLDSPALHASDTLRAGLGLGVESVVADFCDSAPSALERLGGQGAAFVKRSDGGIARFRVPGHSAPRSARVVGEGTEHLLGPIRQLVRSRGIQDYQRCLAWRVLVDDDGAHGALVYSEQDRGWIEVSAGAVVLACGGLGQLFPFTSNVTGAFGDGYALALRSGLHLRDMEFIQFTPTAVANPEAVRGISTGGAILAQPGVRLLNREHDRFMARYDEVHLEGSTRDTVARAIYREVMEGRGTEHGGVYLDMTDVDRGAANSISGRFVRKMREVGIDPLEGLVEVAPEVHFCMGGVPVRDQCTTNFAGLFACGEVAAGVHGANRLNSNALSEAAVFGWRAGQAAAGRALRMRGRGHRGGTQLPDWWGEGRRGRLRAVAELRRVGQRAMLSGAGIERTGEGIASALEVLRDLRLRLGEFGAASPREVRERIEVDSLVNVGMAILLAADARRETRGAHVRVDWPVLRPEPVHIDVALREDGMRVAHAA